jgi:hypothetical protein
MAPVCGLERDSLSWGVRGTVQPANAAAKSLLASTVQLKYQGPLNSPLLLTNQACLVGNINDLLKG